MAMTSAWSRASRSSPQRALAEVDRLRCEIAQLTEELDLKDSRWARVPARRRPYYGPELDAMRHDVGCYSTWFNEHRPHTALGGRTPLEVYRGLSPANEAPRFEVRPRWPRKCPCASPAAQIKGKCGTRFTLMLSRFENRPHLPVVELRRAA